MTSISLIPQISTSRHQKLPHWLFKCALRYQVMYINNIIIIIILSRQFQLIMPRGFEYPNIIQSNQLAIYKCVIMISQILGTIRTLMVLMA